MLELVVAAAAAVALLLVVVVVVLVLVVDLASRRRRTAAACRSVSLLSQNLTLYHRVYGYRYCYRYATFSTGPRPLLFRVCVFDVSNHFQSELVRHPVRLDFSLRIRVPD